MSIQHFFLMVPSLVDTEKDCGFVDRTEMKILRN